MRIWRPRSRGGRVAVAACLSGVAALTLFATWAVAFGFHFRDHCFSALGEMPEGTGITGDSRKWPATVHCAFSNGARVSHTDLPSLLWATLVFAIATFLAWTAWRDVLRPVRAAGSSQ